MAGSFAAWQSETILARSCAAESFVMRAEEKLTAFLELEATIRACTNRIDEQTRFSEKS
jgi:hypothetical protein